MKTPAPKEPASKTIERFRLNQDIYLLRNRSEKSKRKSGIETQEEKDYTEAVWRKKVDERIKHATKITLWPY